MPAIYTQIYVQYIFAVGNADSLISKDWEDALHKQIAAHLRISGHTPIIIKGSHDHIHVFAVVNPHISVDDLAKDIMDSSAAFVNGLDHSKKAFSWQPIYGAFSYGKTRTNDVYLYIQAQDRYHTKRTFREEFVEFLRLFGLDYDQSQLPRGLEEFNMVAEK